jgi:transposase
MGFWVPRSGMRTPVPGVVVEHRSCRVRCELENFSLTTYNAYVSETFQLAGPDIIDLAPSRHQTSTMTVLPPRLRRPDRQQVITRQGPLEDILPEDHDARMVGAVVASWDLSQSLDTIRARGPRPGRAATDPRILVALWLDAAIRGVGAARALDRLCRASDPSRWLCGGVWLNYHTLSDFRVENERAIDDLLTPMRAVLIRGAQVRVERIAQDGTRVRAAAGSGSFQRRETLERTREAARAHLDAVKRPAEQGEVTVRQRAARHRAATERHERLGRALEELAELERAKAEQKEKPTKRNPPRASTTDPLARYRRMPDGGSRPAFNVQLATDTASRAVLAVDVTNVGSDAGQAEPMRQRVEGRTGRRVKEQLIDGGFVKREELDRTAAAGVTVEMPVPRPRKEGTDPHRPKATDSEAVAQWRQRMGTDPARAISKERASTIETVNGALKTRRGLDRFRVRGRSKARCVALWCVLGDNLVHFGAALLSLLVV